MGIESGDSCNNGSVRDGSGDDGGRDRSAAVAAAGTGAATVAAEKRNVEGQDELVILVAKWAFEGWFFSDTILMSVTCPQFVGQTVLKIRHSHGTDVDMASAGFGHSYWWHQRYDLNGPGRASFPSPIGGEEECQRFKKVKVAVRT